MSNNIGEASSNGGPEPTKLAFELDRNVPALKDVFADCADVNFRPVTAANGTKACLVYIAGLVDTKELSDNALRPFIEAFAAPEAGESLAKRLSESLISVPSAASTSLLSDVVHELTEGGAALLLDRCDEAVVLRVKGGMRRAVEQSTTEVNIRGPKEAFTEDVHTNAALLRFKLKTPQLKIAAVTVGEQTQTTVYVSYLHGVADPKVVHDVQERIRAIRIDGVLDSGYIEECIEDHPFSPFPQLQYTERPDTAAAMLLEGRVVILVDGTPSVLTGPITFWQLMHSSEDYYERYFIGNLLRWLRYAFLFLALYLPALYIAVTTFHQDMLPTSLMFSIAASREPIPFPALFEALIMEIAFEALREAGIRLPKIIGQAVSILGALVIGQAAVQAGIVSAPVVIVVSLTGIASFTVPKFNFAITVRMLRFPLMLLASIFGVYGIVLGSVWIVIHLCGLTSFGVPYLTGLAPFRKSDQKDIFIRAPWWAMVLRPSFASRNRRRMNNEKPPQGGESREGATSP
ncbi:spore germination protein [Paenibacillus antri]|uniref:Spore germination protein n=1 Tax=Paenibacillus antri TaxID=2582848 RepID=A0A5R9GB88_9BACL|nr:spore germination protein [Paenibacillus antri]TLS53732.1 spore germination protein [Paenibacillus antri]